MGTRVWERGCRTYLLAALPWAAVLVLAAPVAAASLGDVVIDSDTTWTEGSYDLDSLTITDAATLSVAGGSTLNVSGELAVRSSSTLLLQGKNVSQQIDNAWRGAGISIHAGRVTVEASSAISADGQGYMGTAGPGAGASDPVCAGPTAGGGGGYGGVGGGGQFGASGGGRYGLQVMPIELGSGGGNNPSCGATSTENAGGGAMALQISGVLQLDGRISADAATGIAPRLGGGAGGSIYVTAKTLTGAGHFSARGAAGGSGSAGGGGGGRIAVYYEKAPSFAGFAVSNAEPGNGFQSGQSGTVAFFDTSTPNFHLYVYRELDFAADSQLSYDAITLDNAATLRVGGGSVLSISGELVIQGGSTLLLEGKNTTALVDGEWSGVGVQIDAAGVTIEQGSSLSADGQGYVGTSGPGAGGSDPACAGSTAGAGGGHGGAGGASAFGRTGGSRYGVQIAPVELGSGGGNNPGCNVNSKANAGGGAIVLNVVGVLQLDGAITANGAGSLPDRLGGGAGGSIYVIANTLTGTGLFSADGVSGGNAAAGGGGGGRIAVYYHAAPSFGGFAVSSAEGGAGFTPGDPGTVAFFDTSVPGMHLHVYRDLDFAADSVLAYDAITLENAATLRIGGGSVVSVSGDLTLRGNSTMLLQGKNTSALLAGEWRGAGVEVNAANVTVEKGSSLSADGQGYVGTAGPGAGASDPQCAGGTAGGGGGYGGSGGARFWRERRGDVRLADVAVGSRQRRRQQSRLQCHFDGERRGRCHRTECQRRPAARWARERRRGHGVARAPGRRSRRLDPGDGGNSDRLRSLLRQTAPTAATPHPAAAAVAASPSPIAAHPPSPDSAPPPPTAAMATSLASGERWRSSTSRRRRRISMSIRTWSSARTRRSSTAPSLWTMRRHCGSAVARASSCREISPRWGTRRCCCSRRTPRAWLPASGVERECRSTSAMPRWKPGRVSPPTARATSAPPARAPGAAIRSAAARPPEAGQGTGGPEESAFSGRAAGAPYGSSAAPTTPGSGGGNNPGCNVTSTANAGGGAIFLGASGTLLLDGAITADAAGELAERLGGGSGGSVYVIAHTLSGSGSLSANGAGGGSVTAGGGGGGRLAVYAMEHSAFDSGAATANGGTGNESGAPGTVLFVTTPPGDANCDGRISAADPAELLRLLAGGRRALCGGDDANQDGVLDMKDLSADLYAVFE